MKRQRSDFNEEAAQTGHLCDSDVLSRFADALRGQTQLVVLHPNVCFSCEELAASGQREAAQALSLLVFTTDTSSALTTSISELPEAIRLGAEKPHQRIVLRGVGIIDYTCAGDEQNSTKRKTEPLLVLQTVPISLCITPWTLQLPPRLQKQVFDDGATASVEELTFGLMDAGPVPEGYVTREAIALVDGLPRCCVQAVSGSFPIFQPVESTLGTSAEGDGGTEVQWRFVRHDAVSETTRSSRAAAHVRDLAAFRTETAPLASALSHLRQPDTKAAWVLVSYPDGVPPISSRASEKSGGARSPRQKRRARGKCERDVARDACMQGNASSPTPPTPSPLFILPASVLCQCLSLHAGWQRVAPGHRALAEEAVQRVTDAMKSVTVQSSGGVSFSIQVVCKAHRGSAKESATLQKASAV